MADGKLVKDVMIGIFEYPHIPYWFTINQAVRIIKVSFISSKKYPEPMAILVFDEKYNLMGTLTLKDILRGLEPRFMQGSEKAQGYKEQESELSLIWDTLFTKQSKELAEKPVSEIMAPAKQFVDPADPVTKAAYLMVHHDLVLLPVLENKKKFVGLVRMIEVFDEISDSLIKE
ncbi:MAG: CBS domain-containing protein [Thermodesulfovibrionales bacterium]|nr:CBS domain-containing protein [Thermodesulfovibrionales bacterium]MDQ7786044.1 CBS domain-containing protein [Thermodesulfovibrionales bacterium]